MLITLTIFSLVMISVSSSVLYFYRTNANALEQSFALSSARKGVESLVRDIREASYSDDGAFPIVSIGANSMTFYSDTDRDANIERMRYFLEGTILKKGTLEATGNPPQYVDSNEVITIVSEDIRNGEDNVDIFDYFDNTNVEITNFSNVTDVAFVRVNLIVNINPARFFMGDTDETHDRHDLLIVGDSPNEKKMLPAIKDLEAEMGKEVRYAIFTTKDFRYRLDIRDRLVRDVLDYPHKVIIDRLEIS